MLTLRCSHHGVGWRDCSGERWQGTGFPCRGSFARFRLGACTRTEPALKALMKFRHAYIAHKEFLDRLSWLPELPQGFDQPAPLDGN